MAFLMPIGFFRTGHFRAFGAGASRGLTSPELISLLNKFARVLLSGPIALAGGPTGFRVSPERARRQSPD